ncbi:peptidase S11 [Prosthecochloris sp. ZM]|uniref:D-alanyl-D-alanine carboxypeptidase family protein n=1 Tax=unclassified Prosthecochloris TaxID=2632826 RepID=UPI000DF83CB7|nr:MULTISPECIES: D-alanyl-D-alanine carboxypeptidase [unclassified Prosthecochloris]NEX11117.1 D-alanyl-D-alanine carboxypeptidase [Prosthecochloris sp.]RDD29450.1 peptidase S11 [Prosthecochloris sp. ZM]
MMKSPLLTGRRSGAVCTITAVFACLMFFCFPVPSIAEPHAKDSLKVEPLDIASYILKDIGRSAVLLEKDPGTRHEPASLTKILTCIIAIESARLNEFVTIPLEATQVEPTKAGFLPGEKIRLLDLVKAAMVKSSNDAAFAIAIHLGGSVQGFAAMMNAKAAELGLSHSCFTNPAGFDRHQYVGHYSTAGDMLRLTEYAIGNQIFNYIAGLDEVSITEKRSGKIYRLKTSNKLLHRYPYAVGIKTGYTFRAGKCLIARAKKGDRDVVLVMLNARLDRWSVAEELFEKAFSLPGSERAPFGQRSHDMRASLILKGNELQ